MGEAPSRNNFRARINLTWVWYWCGIPFRAEVYSSQSYVSDSSTSLLVDDIVALWRDEYVQ
ncbi:MAG: hypothetical protein WLagBPW_06430 [Shewanella algae]